MRTKNILNYSLKEISNLLNVDRETAKQIRGVIAGTIDPETIPDVSEWVLKCFNRPRDHEIVFDALNRLMETYGIEGLENDANYIDSYFQHFNFLYLNTGDTYKNTIIFDCDTFKYFIGTWGDIVESW